MRDLVVRLRPPPGTPSWHWPLILFVVAAFALLTVWLSDRTGEVVGSSCVKEGLNQPVCHELRGRNQTVFASGLGLIVLTVVGYRVVVGRIYGGDAGTDRI
ncbi:MAG: hypothetical protein ACRDYW_11730 [Acidimicrobiales bacterium]